MSFFVDQIDDGAFLPDWKDKGVGYKFGEDYFVTTPYGISLADGVGGSSFASLHLSKYLTTFFGYWILFCQHDTNKNNLCKDFDKRGNLSFFRSLMSTIINRKLDIVDNILKQEEKKIKDRTLLSSFKKFSFNQGSTFVSAYFSPYTQQRPLLNVFQKGDSLALVLRFNKKSMNWKPYAYTSDDQEKFNQPYQYIAINMMRRDYYVKDSQIRFFSIEPRTYDIVILGSDGLFDNLPVSIITLAVNAMIKKLSKNIRAKEESKISPRLYLRSYLEAYKRIIGKLKPSDFGDNPQQQQPSYTAADFDESWKEKEPEESKAKEVDEGLEKSVSTRSISIQTDPIEIDEDYEMYKSFATINTNLETEDGFQILKYDSEKKEDDEEFEIWPPNLDMTTSMNHKSAPLDPNPNKINSKTVNLEESVYETQAKPPSASKTVPEETILTCQTKNLFFHKETKVDFDDWKTFQGLESCFETILDQLFKFEVDDYAKLEQYYKPRVVAEAIAEFAKELTLDSSGFTSPFWIRAAQNTQKLYSKLLKEKQRKILMNEPLTPEEIALAPFTIEDMPFKTKPDDISVIASLVVYRDLHRPQNPKLDMQLIAKAKKAETFLINRLIFMDERNQFELEQDLKYVVSSNFM